jgi:hypothetical protein
MRALCTAISKKYAPDEVKSVNFLQPRDGKQHVVLYYRSLLTCLKRVLANPRYAGAQYTSFRCLKTEDGVRVFGAFNNGNWYEFAHAKAQTLGGGQPVSVVPFFMGSDATVARKNMSMYPFFACPGCLDDDVRSEPGAWSLVAVIPHYNIKAARRAGRAEQGPMGYRRRKVRTLITLNAHCAYLAHFFDWSALVCSKYVSCAQCAQNTFEIRAKCVEFAHSSLIARKSTSSQQKCTPCAHLTHLMPTCETLCAYSAYFGYSRARSTLMNTDQRFVLCRWKSLTYA